ncbi:MAG: hypothetical protein DRH11_00410 [Deltaproteobacteria bacterium]|nr:MAG: hypothetical protein DRH11_00410 [Deltaproteobacteria bacterium]
MQIRKYRAKTIRDAVGKVRDVLGPEAMIISTKKVRGNGKNDIFEITAAPAHGGGPNEPSSSIADLKAELMSIKEMITLLDHTHGTVERLIWNPAILSLYAKLIRNGVNESYARTFLARTSVFNKPFTHGANNDRAVKIIIEEIKRVIKVNEPFESNGKNRVVAALVGTTGVGKTTTIAKLAAQLMLKARKKVGLVSIDNYRIGALEQIKTYANILGVPCFPAFCRTDLLLALKRMEDRDVVLIDTAGQSQYDLSRIEELRQIIPDDLPITSHLLLSVATTELEMSKTVNNFSPLGFQSYIFTKLDESERHGSILNLLMNRNLPISYITTGQNVPEDIEEAKKDKILRLLLNRN